MEASGVEGAQRLWAVRGAVQAERNERDAILASAAELLGELISRNELSPGRIVDVIFTCTDDLDAAYPAVAARELGLERVPLLCTREMRVVGSMELVIRVLVQYYAPREHQPAHVYLGATQALRADLH